ncbi:Leukocyte receptor cluster member 8-like [Porphyridium purpureum]|uniref:Leukocyte receptor cluster member 8-like n=1 Tax=Porphyridium purpureum TaxID=35688 RepID=A0A5J4YN33_PORPP|nr:Leukocyte receptor cluster member 8-like [Porphyridium purpureum]|eukprot:POR3328..scf222_8
MRHVAPKERDALGMKTEGKGADGVGCERGCGRCESEKSNAMATSGGAEGPEMRIVENEQKIPFVAEVRWNAGKFHVAFKQPVVTLRYSQHSKMFYVYDAETDKSEMLQSIVSQRLFLRFVTYYKDEYESRMSLYPFLSIIYSPTHRAFYELNKQSQKTTWIANLSEESCGVLTPQKHAKSGINADDRQGALHANRPSQLNQAHVQPAEPRQRLQDSGRRQEEGIRILMRQAREEHDRILQAQQRSQQPSQHIRQPVPPLIAPNHGAYGFPNGPHQNPMFAQPMMPLRPQHPQHQIFAPHTANVWPASTHTPLQSAPIDTVPPDFPSTFQAPGLAAKPSGAAASKGKTPTVEQLALQNSLPNECATCCLLFANDRKRFDHVDSEKHRRRLEALRKWPKSFQHLSLFPSQCKDFINRCWQREKAVLKSPEQCERNARAVMLFRNSVLDLVLKNLRVGAMHKVNWRALSEKRVPPLRTDSQLVHYPEGDTTTREVEVHDAGEAKSLIDLNSSGILDMFGNPVDGVPALTSPSQAFDWPWSSDAGGSRHREFDPSGESVAKRQKQGSGSLLANTMGLDAVATEKSPSSFRKQRPLEDCANHSYIADLQNSHEKGDSRQREQVVDDLSPGQLPVPGYFYRIYRAATSHSYLKGLYLQQFPRKVFVSHDHVNGVVGQNMTVLKEFLRQTERADPAKVRPYHILKEALSRVRAELESGSELYQPWAVSQLKSIRQDLILQNIEDQFTLEVYEYHAHAALVNGDMTEFNQCLDRLHDMYMKGNKSPREAEFFGLYLLYQCYVSTVTRSKMDFQRVFASFPDRVRSSEPVLHAWSVCCAFMCDDVFRMFRLYRTADEEQKRLMDCFAGDVRVKGLKFLFKGMGKVEKAFEAQYFAGLFGYDSTQECIRDLSRFGISYEPSVGLVPVPEENIVNPQALRIMAMGGGQTTGGVL